ncbi:MAG: carbamoyltransferase HypF [Conexibacter sp.]|nr:carbamoyltransferase HypF [Conexibacter sp.]
MTATRSSRRVRARVEGTVQGVGFRPFAYRLARELGLAGHVLNDERGVLLEVEGPAAAVEACLVRLDADAPPLARVRRILREELAPTGERGFAIAASARGGPPQAPVAPDTATCADCLAELLDPTDRRHRYPFVNCTNCGPRFTIVRDIPYDRPFTTMASFAMCARCQAEYDDPLDRRFHAQPNACPDCGPRARLLDAEGTPIAHAGLDAVAAAARALLAGRIVAVKGIGGYHLACRADDEEAVGALRARKRREDRPFALMVEDVAAARSLVALALADEALLCAPARPIVLVRRRDDAHVADAVAPGVAELGLMLPYAPLHHLLLRDAGVPLVMTSGNVSDEPIAFDDDDALSRLAAIADRFLVHDRPIETRTDDSVVRTVELAGRRRPLALRRSRGQVPAAIDLPLAAAQPLLGCGAELKSTFCLAKGASAWVSHHVGDLENYETLCSFHAGIGHFERLFAVTPKLVAHDLHPDYLSTAYAAERAGVRLVGVQHHHAHLAACLAEHGEQGPAVGAIFDGTGYGLDGAVWGGELLVGGLASFTRGGHLRSVRLPGGEQAVRQPWRMACAWLLEALGDDPGVPPALAGRVDPARWATIAGLARSGFCSPPTTSMGRLFDAVAVLCGLRAEVSYEGQAAIELEALATRAAGGSPAAAGRASAGYPLPLRADGVLDAAETVRAVVADLARGTPAAVVAARFHAGVAAGTAAACGTLAGREGLDTVVLSGGVFQNRLLLEATAAALDRAGLRVLVPALLPPNDGGIAFGQVAVAAALGGD